MKYYYTIGTIAKAVGKSKKEVLGDVAAGKLNPRDLKEVGFYLLMADVMKERKLLYPNEQGS